MKTGIKRRKRFIFILCMLLMPALTGCSRDGISFDGRLFSRSNAVEEKVTGISTGAYDSADTAVITSIDPESRSITFLNMHVFKQYTLSYTGTTTFYDSFGQGISVAQLERGEICDLCFRKLPKSLISLTLSPAAWEIPGVKDIAVDETRRFVTFGDSNYSLPERIYTGGQTEELPLSDISDSDVVTVRGIGSDVYSIVITRGHGYLRLTGDEYFVGGWLEVGGRAEKIKKDLVVCVPAGEHTVVVKNEGHGGSKSVTIYENEEVKLDISDLKGEEIKLGNVFFTLTPSEAEVYIDGEKVDTSEYVPLEYGIHQMIVKATGYETISQYLHVGQPNASLHVEMDVESDPTPEDTDTDASDIKDGDEETADNSAYDALSTMPVIASMSGEYKVTIKTGEGTEVYVDGNYIGVAPASFPKTEGKHTVTLRKSGCQTRTYDIEVDAHKKDVEFSFAPLAAQ